MTKIHEGRPRGAAESKYSKIHRKKDTMKKKKYVNIIPHESAPGNYIILEIQPWTEDEDNCTIPDTTESGKAITVINRRREEVQKLEVDRNNNNINTLQVPEILNVKTSALWKIYNERKRIKVHSQEVERRNHICSSKYKD